MTTTIEEVILSYYIMNVLSKDRIHNTVNNYVNTNHMLMTTSTLQ